MADILLPGYIKREQSLRKGVIVLPADRAIVEKVEALS